MAPEDPPLWPGDKLAIRGPHGWLGWRADRLNEYPKGWPANKPGGPGCGNWCPPDWGWPPVVCSDHMPGWHAAAAYSIWGPRIICVWRDEAGSVS